MQLHHGAEPNQPAIDQATAQSLIGSLTQGNGQNSQKISHLLGRAQALHHNVQQAQGVQQIQQVPQQAPSKNVSSFATTITPAPLEPISSIVKRPALDSSFFKNKKIKIIKSVKY